MSAVEITTNFLVRFLVAIILQILIYPLFGITASASQHATISAIFTVLGFARAFTLRRIFNYIWIRQMATSSLRGQSRRMSFLESLLNLAVGIVISFVVQITVFPLFGLHATVSDHLAITTIFTIIGLFRSYCLRRVFNYLHLRWLAAK